jgi:hypothetical protein
VIFSTSTSDGEPAQYGPPVEPRAAILPSRMVAEVKALAREMPADSGAPAGTVELAQINLLWMMTPLGTISAHRS